MIPVFTVVSVLFFFPLHSHILFFILFFPFHRIGLISAVSRPSLSVSVCLCLWCWLLVGKGSLYAAELPHHNTRLGEGTTTTVALRATSQEPNIRARAGVAASNFAASLESKPRVRVTADANTVVWVGCWPSLTALLHPHCVWLHNYPLFSAQYRG
ncbi:hypothetical protein HOY80DRAFT_993407 [Tuber brumale]|nr:hypothetical protein HOY80DRAFT_993407 [Tuber brumale]